jgi:hypothetical protein
MTGSRRGSKLLELVAQTGCWRFCGVAEVTDSARASFVRKGAGAKSALPLPARVGELIVAAWDPMARFRDEFELVLGVPPDAFPYVPAPRDSAPAQGQTVPILSVPSLCNPYVPVPQTFCPRTRYQAPSPTAGILESSTSVTAMESARQIVSPDPTGSWLRSPRRTSCTVASPAPS